MFHHNHSTDLKCHVLSHEMNFLHEWKQDYFSIDNHRDALYNNSRPNLNEQYDKAECIVKRRIFVLYYVW